MVTRMRADVALVERGLFESRAKARAAIEAGLVRADGVRIAKASEVLSPAARIEAQAPHPWVSRGGMKLAHALDVFGFDPAGRLCLDIGASTGGFTQVLLARGATLVLAIDVGHGQLHTSLAKNPRVISLEKTDARSLTRAMLDEAARACGFETTAPVFIACDVSFIGLGKVLPSILPLATPRSELAALIKPQFEAGAGRRKQGIVRDPAVHRDVCEAIDAVVRGLGWTVLAIQPSPIVGGDGNREFLLGARCA